jgi:hypothetical protein
VQSTRVISFEKGAIRVSFHQKTAVLRVDTNFQSFRQKTCVETGEAPSVPGKKIGLRGRIRREMDKQNSYFCRSFLLETDAEYGDVLYHTEILWLN